MLNSVCDFVKDLMPFDASKIIQGRSNFQVVDFSDDIVIVDVLTMSPSNSIEKYDYENEIMTYSNAIKGVFTIDFFGDNALSNASKFVNLQSSQKSIELQTDLNIGVFHSKSVKNLKEQVGTNYYQRYQIELVVYGIVETDVEVLRIDKVPVDIITDASDSVQIIVSK
jgi:hypothetical protein